MKTDSKTYYYESIDSDKTPTLICNSCGTRYDTYSLMSVYVPKYITEYYSKMRLYYTYYQLYDMILKNCCNHPDRIWFSWRHYQIKRINKKVLISNKFLKSKEELDNLFVAIHL